MKRRGTAIAIALATLAVPALVVDGGVAGAAGRGCSAAGTGGDWPSYGHDDANTRSQPLETGIGVANVGALKEAWTFSAGAALNSTPTEVGGCVFVGSSAGVVYALSIHDGSVVWQRQLPVETPGLGGAIVGAIHVGGGHAYVLVNELATGNGSGPYAAALDRETGALLWRSPPFQTGSGYYTNASPMLYDGLIVAGFSPLESDPECQGGVALVNANTGAIVRRVYTVPPVRQLLGYAGGGVWTNPAIDADGYAYTGTGNPFSKTKSDPNTNAIVKIDLKRSRPTFGQIVGSYPGNIDQYTQTLEFLQNTAVCAETAFLFTGVPFDDPLCGQLDLDFGASPNLFAVDGRQYVGELQKAGVYHVAATATMSPAWAKVVGTPCFVCNASSTAYANGRVFGEGTLGGVAFGLDAATGGYSWLSPVADVYHYEAFSVANGVVYTVDSFGFLDAFDAATGVPLARRPLLGDAGNVVVSLSSTGVAIARNHVLVAAGSLVMDGIPPELASGYLVAYKA